VEKYEITYITSSAGKVESVEKSIADLGGNVLESIDLGVKQFAFPIKKLTEARFVSVVFHIEKANVNELSKKIAQEKAIIRFILIDALRARKEIKKRKGDKEKSVTEKATTTTEPKAKPIVIIEPEAKEIKVADTPKEKPKAEAPTIREEKPKPVQAEPVEEKPKKVEKAPR